MILSIRIFLFLIAFFLTIGNASSPVFAVTYYVDINKGNDANAGISKQAPLKTIQMAADKTGPGDTVIALLGFYNERVHVTCSGVSGQPIIFQAEGSVVCHGFTIRADYIHIIGFEITDTVNDWAEGAGIHLQGKYGEIRSNYIHDVTRVGIQVWSGDKNSPDTSDCKILGNRIVRAGLSGIEIYGRNHLVEGNDISHTLQRPPKWTNPPDWADADGMRFFGSGHVIRKNHIHDISTADAGNTDPHVDCFQTWGPAYNILIEQNDCDIPDDGMQAIMINALTSPVRDITVSNNVVKAFQFLNVWNCDHLVVLNNTFKSQLSYVRGSAYAIELHDSPNGKVKNNIFYDAGRNEYPYLWNDNGSAAGLEVGNNCHYISNGNPAAGTPWPNDLWVDPKLVNLPANDFRLQNNSPLIDRGIPLAEITNDFDGIVRPQGFGHDIGAFEFNLKASTMSPPNGLRALR